MLPALGVGITYSSAIEPLVERHRSCSTFWRSSRRRRGWSGATGTGRASNKRAATGTGCRSRRWTTWRACPAESSSTALVRPSAGPSAPARATAPAAGRGGPARLAVGQRPPQLQFHAGVPHRLLPPAPADAGGSGGGRGIHPPVQARGAVAAGRRNGRELLAAPRRRVAGRRLRGAGGAGGGLRHPAGPAQPLRQPTQRPPVDARLPPANPAGAGLGSPPGGRHGTGGLLARRPLRHHRRRAVRDRPTRGPDPPEPEGDRFRDLSSIRAGGRSGRRAGPDRAPAGAVVTPQDGRPDNGLRRRLWAE